MRAYSAHTLLSRDGAALTGQQRIEIELAVRRHVAPRGLVLLALSALVGHAELKEVGRHIALCLCRDQAYAQRGAACALEHGLV